MANMHSLDWIKHDDYMTPKSAWENIAKYIPKDKVIWEAFYGDGVSGKYLKELGFNVIHEPIDFFESDEGDIIVSNPPFSIIKDILPRMKELGKPFILILPSQKLHTSYFRKLFANDKDLQLIVPFRRIEFLKMKDGKPLKANGHCCFDCLYFCWKMNLESSLIFLDH